MYQYILLLLLFAAPDEINDALARAESLYFEAKFKDAIQLLQRADEMLRPRNDRLQDKINVKLQLALAEVGLNDTALAKASLRDVYALDPDYRLDAQQFSPKVIALADQARAEQGELRCQAVRSDARKQLDSGNAMALVNLIGSMKSKCSGLDVLEPDTAELLYRTGVDSYKRGQFPDALERFRAAVKLAPKHELAAQYLELTQSKLQVNSDRLLLEWRKSFEARDYRSAAVAYRQLSASNGGTQAREDYRKALSGLVEQWNRACAAGDSTAMATIRGQLADLLPDPAIGQDILAEMKTCTKKGCMPMSSPLAMTRLKVRINPEIPAAFHDIARRSSLSVRVKARIDEKGDVTVTGAEGGSPVLNDAIKSAVEKWKFSPIVDVDGPRCVETEIPITIKAQG